jgi:hypothetical protein
MMKKLVVIVVILISCMFANDCFPQGLHSTSNKAIRIYNEALEAYNFVDYHEAEILFLEAITHDTCFYEAYMMLGELYSKLNRYAEAAVNYSAALRIDSTFYRPVYFSLANAEMMSGDYAGALVHYRSYLGNRGNSEKNRIIAMKNIRNCEFAIEAIKKPVPFNPVSVGSTVNTSDDEYWPSITADGQMLMFTRQVSTGSEGPLQGKMQEDFYLSTLAEKGWEEAFNAGEPLNTRNNEGAQTLSSSGNYMFFTACDRPLGMGSCDIYFSAAVNGNWTVPFNIGAPVNTTAWESTPSISSDENMLFFASNRPGGLGGKDLWFTVLDENGKWTPPVNMGSKVNTEGDEMSPFIHFDGKTLYFASDGRPGMGGFDIYMTRMNDDTTWTEPLNIGYPVNTFSDEMGLVIEASGQKAFFSSKRENNNGKDIFCFNVYESMRPEPVAYLKGKVMDRETGKLLKAGYELINLSTNRITIKSSTDENGNFLVCLPSGFNYGINVAKDGYLFFSENFMFKGQHTVTEPFIKRIYLNPVRVGEKMLLANVFYEIDSWELKRESVAELDNLTDLMFSNENVAIEIGGYTDSTGTDQHNLILSEKRALSVVKYLINKGISSDRLKYRGYGNTSPLGDNVTNEGRKLNRRTEVKVIAP